MSGHDVGHGVDARAGSDIPATTPRPSMLSEPLLLVHGGNKEPKRTRSWLLVGGPVVVALVSFLVLLHHATIAPREQDWLRASRIVRDGWEPGDVVRVEPSWATQAHTFLRELPIDRVSKPEMRRLRSYRRLWVLATMGHDCAEGTLPDTPLLQKSSIDRIDVCLYSLPYRGEPLYDFRERLHDAKVQRRYRARTETCTIWAKGQWHCGKVHPWQFVGPAVKDVDDEPREGIWAHPLDEGARLIITYPAVPMGKELDLSAGLTLKSILSGEGADVHFQVDIRGQEVLHRVIHPTQKGWFHWPIDTSRWAGSVVPVRFTIWTKDYQVRQFMFDGRVWAD